MPYTMPKDDDVDDLDSIEHEEEMSSSYSESFAPKTERDEVKEVKKMSQKDTSRVIFWRTAVTVVLLLTAVAVTLTTYKLLKKAQNDDVETAFLQFSRALGDAAIAQQQDIRQAFRQYANIASAYAQTNNKTWPFVTIPLFQSYGEHTLTQSGTELFNMFMRVEHKNREPYVNYTTANHEAWVKEGHMARYGNLDRLNEVGFHPYISNSLNGTGFLPDVDRDYYFCAWHMSPPPTSYGLLNWNIASYRHFDEIFKGVIALKNESLVSPVGPYVAVPTALTHEEHDAMHSKLIDSDTQNPHSFVYTPIHKVVDDYESDVVAIIGTGTAWDAALLNLLPDNVIGIDAIITNDCNQSYTYQINGKDAIYLGVGDKHDPKYDDWEVLVNLAVHSHPDFTSTPGHCQYSMHLYPSSSFVESYDNSAPEIYAGVIALTFVLVAIVFFVYDMFVQRRNTKIVNKAAQSNGLVTSMIPDHLRDRLIGEQEREQGQKGKGNLKAFMADSANTGGPGGTGSSNKPLADLFLETTVMFADISGFTAWSSVREPTQVFTLLETIYQAFDYIAKKRRIFKVETVGDCYVAVCGLPDPRHDHAVAMARFAKDILSRFHILSKELEVTLGPDTGDLALRIGMHSGPVTAGVLRGERARFQLFGDTMNVTARLESSSKRGRIQVSKETAELLKKSGKEAWLEKREDTVEAKGKGSLETYWVNVHGERAGSVGSVTSVSDVLPGMQKNRVRYGKPFKGLDERTHRLVDWNVEMLLGLMKQIVARRSSRKRSMHSKLQRKDTEEIDFELGDTPLEEVREIIALPEFDNEASQKQQDPEKVKIPEEVVGQLHHLVSCIAKLYNPNPFHNFDHASHVVMSVIKLMSRIAAPSHLDGAESQALHDHTYGITSDPLTQFACAFSALIHDVDHVGVSNAQLVKEGVPLAFRYSERSVAEQNSLDLSWDLLMCSDYKMLRGFLFPTQTELVRFRQLVVNSVMSTDIVDKDLKTLRNARWDKAFKQGDSADHVDDNPRDEVNRKATIVIEHIIQASDISHTMQHWHVYRKWNQNLFEELYVAYLNGRMDKDPADFWWKGEFGFFDFYIIPLTKKLKECGVFGVSSGEYLNYALKNREEWEARGEEVVAGMIKEVREKYGIKVDGKVQQVQQLKGDMKTSTPMHTETKPEQGPVLTSATKPEQAPAQVWC